ncbi:hypothetical protein QBC39DRAFT_346380 [Podospora conica]|nr:hypothetical protein QBC39DRAFT_346380 [Schizothecium conicum]
MTRGLRVGHVQRRTDYRRRVLVRDSFFPQMPDVMQVTLADRRVSSRESSESSSCTAADSAGSQTPSGDSRKAANHGYHHGKRNPKNPTATRNNTGSIQALVGSSEADVLLVEATGQHRMNSAKSILLFPSSSDGVPVWNMGCSASAESTTASNVCALCVRDIRTLANLVPNPQCGYPFGVRRRWVMGPRPNHRKELLAVLLEL